MTRGVVTRSDHGVVVTRSDQGVVTRSDQGVGGCHQRGGDQV